MSHDLTRTPHPASIIRGRQVTYSCSCDAFTVTDTGDEAKREWLRHLLNVKADEVASNG